MRAYLTCLLTLLMGAIFSPSLFAQEEEAGTKGVVEAIYRKEIEQLSKNKKMQAAFQSVIAQNQKSREELITLTEIAAPPFKEAERAAYFAGMLRQAGADSVWIDEVGNVVALREGKKRARTVALDAHLDTVFPEGTNVKVRVKGDTLFAPGVGDDTRGLAMLVCILRAMEQAQVDTDADILFIGTVGEEGLGDLRGVKHLFSGAAPKIDSWISIDGGDLGRVSTKGLGSYRYRITYKGPGGHSWGAFGLANPQHALGSAIHYFSKSADEFTKTGLRTSYNVGRIGGGTSVNSIAFESWMEIDMRSESPSRLNEIERLMKTAVQTALDDHNAMRRRGPALTVDVVKIGDRPSGELPENLPLIQRAMAAVAYFGSAPQVTRGSTNANIPIAKGIPAVTIGRGGRGGDAHALTEWWYDQEGFKATQLALLTLVAEAGLAK